MPDAVRPIRKVLVANRGEIALRVLRTCREMGIKTVGVYSDADRNALHVRAAYQAVRLGPALAADSYLRGDRIIEAAKRTGADAIHPGFGVLSENAEFVRQVRDAGLVFIGPSPEAIEAMGDKIEARKRMIAADVPVVPGTAEPATDDQSLLEQAEAIGFPVMIKASAGGGGKGIRIVREPGDLVGAAARARSEAKAAFSNDAIYLEKFLTEPRHIEVQVFGDHHGNVVHLGERECSIQRRHQKVIEERPSPLVDDEMREAMGAAAVKAARAIDYVGAGTLEFMVDADKNFYMLEMNTRLQVEHPITEMTTDLDLVRWQLLVAAGEPLPLKQDEVRFQGHAIEARVYAEDADGGFLPSTGTVDRLEMPGGPGVRVDTGLFEGMEVTPYYDPMLAKVVVHGRDREAAIERMARTLTEMTITGVTTNLPFLRRVVTSDVFRGGRYDTGTIEAHPELTRQDMSENRVRNVAMIAATMAHVLRRRRGFTDRPSGGGSAWVDAFRPGDGGLRS
jgi:acetyl-CoA carboxylase biotin carboxylase subunit